MHILFIDDDDDNDSINIDDVHLSNVESNIVARDNVEEGEEYGNMGFYLKLWICSYKDIKLLLYYFGTLNINVFVSVIY